MKKHIKKIVLLACVFTMLFSIPVFADYGDPPPEATADIPTPEWYFGHPADKVGIRIHFVDYNVPENSDEWASYKQLVRNATTWHLQYRVHLKDEAGKKYVYYIDIGEHDAAYDYLAPGTYYIEEVYWAPDKMDEYEKLDPQYVLNNSFVIKAKNSDGLVNIDLARSCYEYEPRTDFIYTIIQGGSTFNQYIYNGNKIPVKDPNVETATDPENYVPQAPQDEIDDLLGTTATPENEPTPEESLEDNTIAPTIEDPSNEIGTTVPDENETTILDENIDNASEEDSNSFVNWIKKYIVVVIIAIVAVVGVCVFLIVRKRNN